MSIGDLLRDDYRIDHALGAGSGGQVYKAVQLSTGQVVAIKVLSLEGLAGEVRDRRRERFRREIIFCSQLYHPDIVRLLDSGELDDDHHFAVFEYIPGSTLAQLLSETGMLGVERTRNLMMQLLPPLAYAHAKGIFHRDLKPSNIMVTADGHRDRLKILDFGISIARGQEHGELSRLTLSHEWVGTPTYAAPEQLRGEAASAKSDLYAWGLIFLECLTGSSVISGRSLPEIIRHQMAPEPHQLPVALTKHRLGTLLARVLERNAERRMGEAQALYAAMETISTSDLVDAHGYLRSLLADSRPRSAPLRYDTLTDEQRPAPVERRHATVVCCKVVFGGPNQASNAEQLDTMIEDTNALVREIMLQFGANVSSSFGEYSLSYFGLSRASDADARLALRASLEMSERVVRAPSWLAEQGLTMNVQIGIHNGPVTVQLREGRRRQIDGVTAGISMRLASFEAPVPGTVPIVVSEDFRALVERYADFEPLDVPGAPESLQVQASYRLARHPRPGAWLSLDERSVFVGRQTDLAALLEAWKRSRSSAGVAVLVSAEPGIGKSRLAMELGARLRAEGVTWLEARCLPEWQHGFLRPLSTLFGELFRTSDGEAADGGLRVQRCVEELDLPARDAVPLLCEWLSLPMPANCAPLAWSPQKRRQMLHELLADVLIAYMARGAALLIEDLHWADPSTLECLDVLVSRARRHPTFILMTTRPGQRFSWSLELDALALTGLDSESSSQLVATLAPELDGRAAARLLDRCDGVPLYIEELALAYRNRPVPSSATMTQPHSTLVGSGGVPSSLRDLLTSRLDEVGEAKGLAQFAAALGREFSIELLSAVTNKDELALLGDLEQLVSAELLLVKRLHGGDPIYLFRHALIRDAAYDGTPPANRQRTHAQIANALERAFPRMVDAQPDTLAHHWEHAENPSRALHYLLLAAKKSAMASAHAEALAQIEHGVALLSQLSDSGERTSREAELMLARGAAIVSKRGYSDPDAARSFERVSALVPAEGGTLELAFAARWGLWYYHNTQTSLLHSSKLANELAAIAKQAGDDTLALNSWQALCVTNFCIGQFDDSIHASHQTGDLYDFDRHRNLCIVRGDDPHLACLSWGGLAEMFQGNHDQAVSRTDQALMFADRLLFPSLQAGVRANAALMYLIRGTSGASSPNLGDTYKHARCAIELAREHGFPFWEIYGRTVEAAAGAALGDRQAADTLRAGMNIWRSVGASLGFCWQLGFAADALRRAGEFEAALAMLAEAEEHCETHTSRFFQPEVYRLRAEVFFDRRNRRRDMEAGRSECAKARAVAADCRSSWWELATLVTLARVPEAATPDELAALCQATSAYSLAPAEPPLLYEARALAAEMAARR